MDKSNSGRKQTVPPPGVEKVFPTGDVTTDSKQQTACAQIPRERTCWVTNNIPSYSLSDVVNAFRS
jgi:hypothetical protein